MSKRKLKEPLLSSTVVDDPACISDDPSSVYPPAFIDPPSVSVDPTDFDDHVGAKLSGVKTELVGQVRSLFADLAKSLGDQFSEMDQKFSQVMPASSSNVDSSDPLHVSQDVANHSFTAPTPVAVRSEHMPDKASFVSHAGDLETTVGRLAAAGVPLGDSPLT